jgi:hypothetical protein
VVRTPDEFKRLPRDYQKILGKVTPLVGRLGLMVSSQIAV